MPEEKTMTFIEHLEELRRRLWRWVAAFVVCFVVVFSAKETVFDHIVFAPSKPDFITYRLLCQWGVEGFCMDQLPFKIVNISLPALFVLHIKVAAAGAFILSLPVLLWQLWLFVAPGLYHTERRMVVSFVSPAFALFVVGVLFGYFVVAPISIVFLGGYRISASVENLISVTSFVDTLVGIILPCGIAFLLPLVGYLLGRWGIITRQTLASLRRYAIVGVLFLAAVLTPPDVVSQILLAIPLYLLFEASILTTALGQQHHQREQNL